MKIQTMEKVVIGFIIFTLVAMIGSCGMFVYTVDKAGGIRNVIVEAGKEVKAVAKEISKD